MFGVILALTPMRWAPAHRIVDAAFFWIKHNHQHAPVRCWSNEERAARVGLAPENEMRTCKNLSNLVLSDLVMFAREVGAIPVIPAQPTNLDLAHLTL
ncbi:MAG: hypothetical protein ACRDHP_11185 [Ktedonobacterales bacterium]